MELASVALICGDIVHAKTASFPVALPVLSCERKKDHPPDVMNLSVLCFLFENVGSNQDATNLFRICANQ